MLQDTATVTLTKAQRRKAQANPLLPQVRYGKAYRGLMYSAACGFPWCASFWKAHVLIHTAGLPADPGAMQLPLHSSEVQAAALLLAAVWLLVPFALKLFRSVVAGRKLRHVPGPRMGLRGVTPVLRVRLGLHTDLTQA